MSSFPTRTGRTAFGPTFENESPVRNPAKEISADTINLLAWNNAGLCQVTPKGVLRVTVAATVPTAQYESYVWNPNGSTSVATLAFESTGVYSFLFSQSYANYNGASVNISLQLGDVFINNAIEYSSTHDGANNVAVLADSTQSWTTNEHIGKRIYNVTDGSSSVITANTATTATGVLSGGSDNDWDTGDEYLIKSAAIYGQVVLDNGYSGKMYFYDESHLLVDPTDFILRLW